MDSIVTSPLVEILYQFYERCTHQVGIDCNDDAFASACIAKTTLWETCAAAPFANETTLTDELRRHYHPISSSSSIAIADENNPLLVMSSGSEAIEFISSTGGMSEASNVNPCHAAPRRCIEKHMFDLVTYDNMRLFYAYAPIAALMCLVALITNAIGLTGLSKIRPKYPRHFLLISMSISDTLLSILTLLKKSGDVISSSSDIQHFFTKYLIVFWQTTFLASSLMLLALAVEAFIALTATFLYETFARRRCIILAFIALVWVFSFSFPLTLLLINKSYDMTFQYSVSGLLLLIIAVTISCYLYAFVLAERARKDISSQRRASMMVDRTGSDGHSHRTKSGRRKSLLTVCLLMTSSIVSWLPLNIYMLLGATVEREFPFYNRLVHAFLIMFHFNAIINPLTYTLRMSAVRTTLRRFLHMKTSNSSILLTGTTTTNQTYSHSSGGAGAVRKMPSDASSNKRRSLSVTCSTPLTVNGSEGNSNGCLKLNAGEVLTKPQAGVVSAEKPRKAVKIMAHEGETDDEVFMSNAAKPAETMLIRKESANGIKHPEEEKLLKLVTSENGIGEGLSSPKFTNHAS